VDRITEVLDQEPEIRDGRRDAGRLRGAIRFDHVTFTYADGEATLRDVDFTIESGQTVALIGQSGAGKSTLVSLLPRLYDATGGAVTIDGRDVRDYTIKSLRENIGVVPQDGALFGGTIRDNIVYGKSDATDEEVVAAARDAYLHDHIMRLPKGYDTVVSERGVSLSGGQRQRLAIARALVKDAPIVVLDEPTTGLDAESEGAVIKALDRLLVGRTAVIIAHRLDTIRRADLIVVLEDGRIVDQGTHDDLMARGGRYQGLFDLQSPEGAGTRVTETGTVIKLARASS